MIEVKKNLLSLTLNNFKYAVNLLCKTTHSYALGKIERMNNVNKAINDIKH